MKKKPLETIETLSGRFGLPIRTLHREVLRGRLPYVSIGGARRFRERDIEVWLERTGPLPRLRLLSQPGLEQTREAQQEKWDSSFGSSAS